MAVAIASVALVSAQAGVTVGAASGASSGRVALSVLPRATHHGQVSHSTTFPSGTGILVRVSNLPRPATGLCVGLASLIDRGSLPLNLGPLHPTTRNAGELHTRIPAGLIGPEPPGPYLVFVGDCARPAPIGEYAHMVISIPR
jgi:hypothetical protein